MNPCFVLLLLINCFMNAEAAIPAVGKPVYIGYFTSWSIYARNFNPSQIPADKLTILNYAFAKIVNNRIALADPWADVEKSWPGDTDAQPFKGNFWQINRVLKGKNPGLKTLISIGGWTMSAPFSPMAANAETRRIFAQSCAEFINRYGFDGVDIDWEYPVSGGESSGNPSDKENFTLLLQEIRNAIGENKLLTAAVSANPANIANLQVPAVGRLLDYVNVMAYDFAGPWEPRTGHQANLMSTSSSKFSVDLAARTLIQQGIARNKLVIGVPFYGRALANVPAAKFGLDQSFSGTSAGTIEAGVLNYYDIVAKIKSGELTRRYDIAAKAVWAYGMASKTFVTYDDPESITEKCRYVLSNSYAGIMSWDLSQEGDGAPLSTAITQALGSIGRIGIPQSLPGALPFSMSNGQSQNPGPNSAAAVAPQSSPQTQATAAQNGQPAVEIVTVVATQVVVVTVPAATSTPSSAIPLSASSAGNENLNNNSNGQGMLGLLARLMKRK